MRRLAVICTGQGAQSVELFVRSDFGKKALALKHAVLSSVGLSPALKTVLQAPDDHPDLIFQNRFAQPLLVLYQTMVWEDLKALAPKPALVAGYSLGELSAAALAGCMTPVEAVRLAALRAEKMDSASQDGRLIAVLGLVRVQVETLARKAAGVIAISISEKHCVVGVTKVRAEELAAALVTAGAARVDILDVTVASHTPFMDAAVEPFRQALRQTKLSRPAVELLAGIDASKVTTSDSLIDKLPEQIHRPVRWDLVMERIARSDVGVVFETGPGRQLSQMMIDAHPSLESRALDAFHTSDGTAQWLRQSLGS